MEQPYTTETITALAQTCIQMGKNIRPELVWLQDRYEQIQQKYHLKNKRETDRFLYRRMYGHAPAKDSDVLKLRYWRTGRYTPGNRSQCQLFGKALELTDTQMRYLIQGYYDRSLDVCESLPEDLTDTSYALYLERRQYMRQLIDTYLSGVPQELLAELSIPSGGRKHFFRHLYFTDAYHYIDPSSRPGQDVLRKHILSSRYDSELSRQMKLIGEIPRRTFLRHLLILGMPGLTLHKLNEQLTFFGYLPLLEEHTMIQGERLDWLLIRLLEQYEELSGTKDRKYCLMWFQETCRTLDLIFTEEDLPRMRFMHFKALDL